MKLWRVWTLNPRGPLACIYAVVAAETADEARRVRPALSYPVGWPGDLGKLTPELVCESTPAGLPRGFLGCCHNPA